MHNQDTVIGASGKGGIEFDDVESPVLGGEGMDVPEEKRGFF